MFNASKSVYSLIARRTKNVDLVTLALNLYYQRIYPNNDFPSLPGANGRDYHLLYSHMDQIKLRQMALQALVHDSITVLISL